MEILRPLLGLRKTQLQDVCRSEGVEWIEDLSNQFNHLAHNNVQKTLCENEDLVSGIAQIVNTCQETHSILQHQGMTSSSTQ